MREHKLGDGFSARRLRSNLTYDLKHYLGSHRLLYWWLYLYRDFSRQWVTDKTVVCIDGFPRTASTFAMGAFINANPNLKYRDISNHTHIAMMIVRSARLGVPCIAVIREPSDTLASWLVARDALSEVKAIEHYTWYYRCVEKVAADVVLADFTAVTGDFQKVIGAVNEKYRTNFQSTEMNEVVEEKIFEDIRKWHAYLGEPDELLPVPSEQRARRKNDARRRIEGCPNIGEARELYKKLLRTAVT